jgi:hypothetical protein
MRLRGLVVGALACLSSGEALGQHVMMHLAGTADDTAAARFIDAARAGTARYRDRSMAIADGYRQVGPDLPAMGEHWLNIALILGDSVDPARPPVLIYVPSPTGPLLAGAAYTRLLTPTDRYPDFPQGLHAWHDHSGFIDDEALPTHHGARHATAAGSNGTRLGILHLWMWEHNAAGDWTADNWALPFIRAGMRAQSGADAAARALVLKSDSGRYFLDVLSAVGQLDTREVGQLRDVLAAAASEARSMSIGGTDTLLAPGTARLSAIWESLWPRIESCLSPAGRVRVAEVRRLWW